jgi:hypothetical protein
LSVKGVLTREDRDRLLAIPDLAPVDRQSIERLYQSWFSQEPISEVLSLSNLPGELRGLVDFPEPSACVLVWTGPMS